MNNAAPAHSVSPKREAILDGAVTCFLEHGYAATSMDNVAAMAGVSKATIYAHFSSKADLFSAVIIRRCEHDLTGGEHWPAKGLDAKTTLTQVATLLLSFLTSPNTLAIHRVVVAEAVRQPDLASAFWEAGPPQLMPKMADIFTDLDQRGLLRVPNSAFAAMMFISMLKSEIFFCRLLGLPDGTEAMGFDDTITTAVDMVLKAYAPD